MIDLWRSRCALPQTNTELHLAHWNKDKNLQRSAFQVSYTKLQTLNYGVWGRREFGIQAVRLEGYLGFPGCVIY